MYPLGHLRINGHNVTQWDHVSIGPGQSGHNVPHWDKLDCLGLDRVATSDKLSPRGRFDLIYYY